MKNNKKEYSVKLGPGFLGCLTLIFVVAKITHYIDWSWWLVFLPMWIVPAVVFGVMGVMVLFGGLCFAAAWLIDRYNRWQRKRERVRREKQEAWDKKRAEMLRSLNDERYWQ